MFDISVTEVHAESDERYPYIGKTSGGEATLFFAPSKGMTLVSSTYDPGTIRSDWIESAFRPCYDTFSIQFK